MAFWLPSDALVILNLILMQSACFLRLSESITLSSTNSFGDPWTFQEDSNVTLVCIIDPYMSIQEWKFENSVVAECAFSSCLIHSNNSGLFKFTENINTFGTFYWTINPMRYEFNTKSFECNDGTNKISKTVTVKAKQLDGQDESCGLRCLSIIIVVIVVPIAILYRCIFKKGPQLQLRGEAKSTCIIDLSLKSDHFPTDSTFAVFRKTGNDNEIQIYECIQDTTETHTTSLELGTDNEFFIAVKNAKGGIFKRSKKIKVKTGLLQLEAQSKSIHEINLSWTSDEPIPDSSIFRVHKRSGNNEHDSVYTILRKEDIKNQTHTMSDLQPNTQHMIYIEVTNGQDITISTEQCIKTLGLLKLYVKKKSIDTIDVCWTSDDHIPDNSTFIIFHKRLASQQSDDEDDDDDEEEEDDDGDDDDDNDDEATGSKIQDISNKTHTISGLQPKTKYKVYINVMDAKGQIITKSNKIQIKT